MLQRMLVKDTRTVTGLCEHGSIIEVLWNTSCWGSMVSALYRISGKLSARRCSLLEREATGATYTPDFPALSRMVRGEGYWRKLHCT